jgi:hypothetical protein
MDLTDLIGLVVALAVWWLLMAKVLPRFGVGT